PKLEGGEITRYPAVVPLLMVVFCSPGGFEASVGLTYAHAGC
ncbi:MAG: hypothetical protein ACI9DH_001693, partial [Halioglobus sp.]